MRLLRMIGARSVFRGFVRVMVATTLVLALTQAAGIEAPLSIASARAQSQPELVNSALELYSAARYQEALKVSEQGLALAEKAEGPEGITVAWWLNHLGLIHSALGDYPKSEASYKRALAIREKVLGPDHPHTAIVLNNLGVLYDTIGRYTEAEPLLKRALAINEKTYGPDGASVATNINNLALVYLSQGRLSEAEPLLKRALAISEKTNGPDSVDTATSLQNLAVLYSDQGRFAEAEPLYKRSIGIYEKAQGADHPDVATAINNLAELYRMQGRYGEAESMFKRALAIDERARGPKSPDAALVMSNLAALYDDIGRYGEAETYLKRAIAILETALGSEHVLVASAITNLASVYLAQGWIEEAEPLYVRALAISEKVQGANHPDTATSLSNLGSLYIRKTQFAKAEPLFLRALSIRENVLGPDHNLTGASLNNLAALYSDMGRYDQAITYAKRGMAITERKLGPNHMFTARAVGTLAVLYVQKGELAEGERLYRQALASLEKSELPLSLELGGVRYRLSLLLLQRGKTDEALDLSRRSIAVLADRRARAMAGQLKGLSAERIGYADFFAQFVRAAHAVAQQRPEREAALIAESFEAAQLQALDETERAVARMSSKFAAGNDELARLLREQQDLLQRLPALTRSYANALGSKDPGTRAQAPAFRDESARISARLNDIDAQLRRDHPAYAELIEPKPVSLAESQALLSDDEAVVFLLPGTGETFLFAAAKTGAQWAKSSLSAQAVSKTVSELRQQLEPNKWQDIYEPYDRARAHSLYGALWAPIAKTTEGKKHVFVVPTGSLTSFPLATLVTEPPKGGTEGDADPIALRDTPWLIKRHALLTLPSISSLKMLRRFANKASGTEPFAGFGDPVFGAGEAALKNPLGPVLPSAAPQVPSTIPLRTPIIAEGPAATGPAFQTMPTPISSLRSILPMNANLRVIRLNADRPTQLSAGAGAIVLAAAPSLPRSADRSVASVFRGTEPDLNKLSLLAPLPATASEIRALAKTLGASEKNDVFLRERATEAQIKTLDMSRKRVVAFATHGLMAGDLGLGEPGLVFTLPTKPSDRDNGYLSASEAARLNLRADWVILSACNTAAGDTPGARGLSGLARAFFLAGAKSLLVSHWTVWDDVAERLTTTAVRRFQTNPADGRGEALRQSMLAVMNDTSSPRFAHPAAWAPFVLVGDVRAN